MEMKEAKMEVVHQRCAGLDVHKQSVVACVRLAAGGEVKREVRTFGTTTGELLALSAWLAERKVTHAAMEATGVYWKPVWHILSEGGFELILANAGHIRNVPGRKTDVNDATWIADLLAHGLIRGSFVPEPAIQELRALMRTRKQLVREQAKHTQRLQKTLEDANIKLDAAISDILGVSGRAIIEAMIAGKTDPNALAELADRRIKASKETLRAALHGRLTRHHRFLLRLHLEQVDALTAAISAIDEEAEARLEPFRAELGRVVTVPGVARLAAASITAEIGFDMTRFPTAGHLLSWAGLCPRNDESAGKRRSSRLKKSGHWLKPTLVQCAWAAVRAKDGYLKAQYYRLKARHGAKKAACAVAASILVAIYHMLKDGTEYQDLGGDYFDRRFRQAKTSRLVRQLAHLGYSVQLAPIASAA
jgi:transposase